MYRYAPKASIAAALAVVLASTTTFAQGAPPKYKRNSPKITVKVEQTERTAGLREKPKAKAEAKAPEITADAFMDIETAVKGIRAAQVEEYRALIEDTDKKDPQLPDLLFRLAELYAQQQRYWRFRAMEMYSKIDKAKGGKKGSLQNEQKTYFNNEAKYLKEAIKVYATLANSDRFKNYPRMDEALFYYAYTLQSAKKVELSRVVYQKLIKDYPGSKFIPYAYLAFADYFFELNDLDKADKFYDKVLEFPKSAVYLYAYYKKGWVYLNQKREQDALAVFFEVSQKTQGKKKYADINKASKKDFVRAYAVVGQPKLALKAFERVDKDYSFNMLKILAGIYLDQGKAEKSIYTHRELIGIAPKDQAVCEWEYNVVQAMMGVGTPKDKTDETETLVKLYLKYKERGVLKGTALDECYENARATTSELARVWHNEAVKTLNFESLGNVERLYQLYVESFPEAKDIGEIQFYYSELLWTRAENESNPRVATERWEKAANAFTDVVKRGNTDPEKKKEAAYAAVLGWKNALAVDPRTQVAATDVEGSGDDKPPVPTEINEREQKMIAAFDVYIKYIKDPKDPELVMMKFLKARIYWKHDHLEEALPLFQEIVDKHLEHETGEYSVNIILDSLIRMKKYVELNDFADQISKKKEFLSDKPSIQERIADIRAVTKRKMAKQLEDSGDHVKCGDAYYDIYKDNPKGPKMDEVLYNAGVCYEDGRSVGLAIAMFNILQKEFPKSNQSQKALVRIGNAYGAAAFYDRAAQAYEDYAKKYGGEKDAPGALGNAVTYRKGVGDDKKAIEDIEFFVKQYKNKMKKEASDALFGMVGIYEKQGNDGMVVKHLERYVHDMGASGGRDRVVIAHAKIGQILWDKSCGKGKGVDGACVKVERERAIRSQRKRRKGTALPARCGEASKIKLTVLKRNPSDVATAQKHFRTAIAEFNKGAGDGVGDKDKDIRIAAASYWASAARFNQAELEYEKFLSIEFPEGLDFTEKKKAASLKRFLKWKADKDKTGIKVNDMYSAVLGQGSAAWAIAAAARMAQITQNYADALYTAEVPKAQRTGPYAEDAYDAYCDQLMEVATPLEEKSVAGFSFCLQESTKRNWFNVWSKLCERELGQIRPQDFPTASELHSEPTMVAPVTDTQGLVSSIRI